MREEQIFAQPARRSFSQSAALLLGLMCASGAQAANPIIMKLSTATIHDTQHEWLNRFAAAVEKDSGGRIKGEVFPASQLGSIPRQIEGVQFGSIQGWMGPPEFLVGVDERYEALSAPGLFSSRGPGHPRDQRSGGPRPDARIGRQQGAGRGRHLLRSGRPRSSSRKPIHHFADFKGLKIRVLASPFQLEMVKRMDASPVAMTLADVLPALQQGAIDGVACDHHRITRRSTIWTPRNMSSRPISLT